MNRTQLKNYAPHARRDFIQAMTDRADYYGLTANQIEPVELKATGIKVGLLINFGRQRVEFKCLVF